LLYAPGSQFVG